MGVNQSVMAKWDQQEAQKRERWYKSRGQETPDFAPEFDDSLDELDKSVGFGKHERARCHALKPAPRTLHDLLQAEVSTHGIRRVLKSLHEIADGIARSSDLCMSFDDGEQDGAAWARLAKAVDDLAMSNEAGAK